MYKTVGTMDMSGFDYIGILEIQDNGHFEIFANDQYLVFGSFCNVGFLESGHYIREDYLSLDDNLQELNADFEVLYRDGKHYTSDNFKCNDRV